MERMLALYGKGRGPRVPVRGRQAALVIPDTSFCEAVHCFVEGPEGVRELVFTGCGEHRLPEAHFVTVEYNGSNRSTLFFVGAI